MAAALAITPASGSITAVKHSARVDVTGADQNNLAAFNASIYPTSPAYVYRIRARRTGSDDLFSPTFSVNESGEFSWNVAFPAAGAWTVTLRNTSGDTQVATLAVTVA